MALQPRLAPGALCLAPRPPRRWAVALAAAAAGRRQLPLGASGRQIVEFALWSAWEDMKNPKPPGKEVRGAICFYVLGCR